MTLPADYMERVYAGVLGKIIGVYLGRPFEGWQYEHILEYLGEINYYVHEKLDVPLIVTDDDISGTFTFLRALPDYGNRRDLTPAQIGQAWLNYLIEERTVLWWGGMGNSTEHTAYLRLKSGIEAPRSGSIELNSQVVAEQIGAQIFIDGWAMVAPGDPALAADLARRAASVSHDGEAIYGAQVVAALEAQAFVEPDLNKLIDTAITFIPSESIIYRMIGDIREWHAKEPDWHKGRELLAGQYGYDKYGGNVHMVPNHGLIILALLYGDDDLQKSLMIVNTAGWDTDCNSGNVGCLLGIKNGLAGLSSGPDYRGPVADRMYLPTADGGRAITDAVRETVNIVNIGRALQGEAAISPKNGARFHFDLPGAVQGFMVEDSVAARDTLILENVVGHSQSGSRSLALRYRGLAAGRVGRAETATFTPSKAVADYFSRRGYGLLASPTLYAGQTIRARLVADENNQSAVQVCMYIKHYDEKDELAVITSEPVELAAASDHRFTWRVPDTGGYPIAFVGAEVKGDQGASGVLYLDTLTWDGAPDVRLNRPYQQRQGRVFRGQGPTMWKQAWVDGFDSRGTFATDFSPETYRLIQNRGRGLAMQGTREWTDYQVTARLTPHMCKAGGVGVRVQGMQRYYALLCDSNTTRLVKTFEGGDTVLAEVNTGWVMGQPYTLNLRVDGNRLVGSVNDNIVLEAADPDATFDGGSIALIVDEGRIGCDHVAVAPLD